MNLWVLAVRLTGLGWYVALCIVFGIVGGLALDGLLETKPLFMLLGILLGSVVAFWGLYKMVQPLLNAAASQGKNDNGSNS
ncbi:MAG: AtpZ/AtpI family protein [Chloroflexi bacterium]|jgi:F0F1-type ATP synthase assembly protein I|nr:AtpZ/AtpI family protein [Chloroflexota bacterium]